MIDVKRKICDYNTCKNDAVYGKDEFHRAQFCCKHKNDNMIHVYKERQCSICPNEYDFLIDNTKYCVSHCPVQEYENVIKRLCKYCDIRESSNFVCIDCKRRSHKKEWGVVRHLRKVIDTKFVYDNYQLNSTCTKRRPDIHFQLDRHDVIVEIDENQHRDYTDICECARINEIVNAIGGKSVIFIRYNPDITRHGNKILNVCPAERIDLLVSTIKHQLQNVPDIFEIKLLQLWYDDTFTEYQKMKEINITNIVTV